MNTELEKAARQALEALESLRNNPNVEIWFDRGDNAITALRRALEQVEQQEPVAWATQLGEYAHIQWGAKRPEYPMVYEFPLYTRPQAREPLTDEQIEPMFRDRERQKVVGEKDAWYWYAWGISDGEAAHGIKGAQHG